jgi:SAM-dependent methyltransferase
MDRRVRLDRQLAQMLLTLVERGTPASGRARVFEAGCGNSLWLPYLGREMKCEIAGVDFSELGCALARQNLEAFDVPGEILRRDFFEYVRDSPPLCDVVVSFGFIEHFPNVWGILETMMGLLRPGGLMFATVPNLAGVYGRLQSPIDRAVLEQHVILRPSDLDQHALRARLVDVETGYVGGPLRLSLLNVAHLAWLPAIAARAVPRAFFEFDRVTAATARLLGDKGRHATWAPYAYVCGRKPPVSR